MLQRRPCFAGLQLLLLVYTAQFTGVQTAQEDDIKELVRQFVSESLADKIAEFIIKSSGMITNKSRQLDKVIADSTPDPINITKDIKHIANLNNSEGKAQNPKAKYFEELEQPKRKFFSPDLPKTELKYREDENNEISDKKIMLNHYKKNFNKVRKMRDKKPLYRRMKQLNARANYEKWQNTETQFPEVKEYDPNNILASFETTKTANTKFFARYRRIPRFGERHPAYLKMKKVEYFNRDTSSVSAESNTTKLEYSGTLEDDNAMAIQLDTANTTTKKRIKDERLSAYLVPLARNDSTTLPGQMFWPAGTEEPVKFSKRFVKQQNEMLWKNAEHKTREG